MTVLFDNKARFVLRWPKGYNWVDSKGQSKKAGEISRGKRSVDSRFLYDSRRRCKRKVGIYFAEVRHPDKPYQRLWLVIARRKGQLPWYLLTNEVVTTVDQGWQIVFAYARRWQIEMSFRYAKSELAMESPRLQKWDNRLKLLLIASIAYAFLLTLLVETKVAFVQWLNRRWCHRTGRKYQQAKVPLYRIRSAISRLWLAFGNPEFSYGNSG